MTKMQRLWVGAAVVAVAVAMETASAATLFYGGDVAVGGGSPSYAPNYENSGTFDRTYASFTVPAGQTWTVSEVFAAMVFQDQVTLGNVSQGRFEFRSGVSAGNAGTLVATGAAGVTVTDAGVNAIFGFYDVGLVEMTLPTPVELMAGDYWVSLTGATSINNRLLMGTTFGAGAVNASPGGDYRDSNFFNLDFSSTPLEPALGLRGTALVPEAGSLVLAAFASLGMAAFRRRPAAR